MLRSTIIVLVLALFLFALSEARPNRRNRRNRPSTPHKKYPPPHHKKYPPPKKHLPPVPKKHLPPKKHHLPGYLPHNNYYSPCTIGNFEHGYYSHVGNLYNFRCNNDYYLSGRNSLRCNAGVWDYNLPRCYRRCHYSPPAHMPSHLYVKHTQHRNYYEGNHLYFGCNNNYVLSGSSYLTCTGGSFQGGYPTCNPPKYGGLLGHLPFYKK